MYNTSTRDDSNMPSDMITKQLYKRHKSILKLVNLKYIATCNYDF